MAARILDSNSELGMLFTRYMAHFAKIDLDARFAALKASFARNEGKPVDSPDTAYANIGRTPEAISAIRATNQRNSALLRLPTELLVTIWKAAFGSRESTRVHGMVCREVSENRILSFQHTCSLLHEVLYPIFLSEEAFVVTVSSSDPGLAASELTQWLKQLPSSSALNGTIKIQILLQLQSGRLPEAEARKLAAEVQVRSSSIKTFQPIVYVEAWAGGGYYCEPDANVLVWLPPGIGYYRYETLVRPTDQDGVWKGWIVTKRTLTPRASPETRTDLTDIE